MKIKQVYKGYFQKSKVFLFPQLNIKKNSYIQPVGSYVAWDQHISKEEQKLIVVYKPAEEAVFKAFERKVLYEHPQFEAFFECANGNYAYVFTFHRFAEDWNRFLKGNYSAFSKDFKARIAEYYGKSSPEWVHIESFLEPNYYYEDYACLLTCNPEDVPEMIELLKEHVELCQAMDEKKETLVSERRPDKSIVAFLNH